MASSSSLTRLFSVAIIAAAAFAMSVHAEIYTLQANCFGYDWNGLGCAQNGQFSTVPVGNHTVIIGGSEIAQHPVAFMSNSTTMSLWSGASPNPPTGTTSGNITLTVLESDVGKQVTYECVVHGFFGTLTFVAAETMFSSTGIDGDNSTDGSSGMANTYTAQLSSDCFGFAWDDMPCSATPSDVTLAPGVYTINLTGSEIVNHPVIFTTDVNGLDLWSGASPNLISGLTSGVVTLTVTAADQGTAIYYRSVNDGFFGRLWLVSSLPLMSTGVSSGIRRRSSTGGIIIIDESTAGADGTPTGSNTGSTGSDMNSMSSSSTGMHSSSSTGGVVVEFSSTGGLLGRTNSATSTSPSVLPAIVSLLVISAALLSV